MKTIILFSLAFITTSYLSAQTNTNDATSAMNWNWVLLAPCFLGIALQEVIYWYELRHDIAKGNKPVELYSQSYWIITIVGIVAFSTASFLYFSFMDPNANFLTIAGFSAAAPRFFKSIFANFKSPESTSPPPTPQIQETRNVPNFDQIPPAKHIQTKRTLTLNDYLMVK